MYDEVCLGIYKNEIPQILANGRIPQYHYAGFSLLCKLSELYFILLPSMN